MASSLRKTTCLLAILFVLVGINSAELKAAGALDWTQASESSATRTTAALNQFDGKGLIDGVIMSSQSANQAYVEIRDTATANSSYEQPHDPIVTVFFGTTTALANAQPLGNVVIFPRPFRVYNGLSTRASNCNTLTNCYTVLYRRVQD